MEAIVKFKIYELKNVLGISQNKALSSQNKELVKLTFEGSKNNAFDTEEEAILSLMKDGKTFREFVILKTVYIINYE